MPLLAARARAAKPMHLLPLPCAAPHAALPMHACMHAARRTDHAAVDRRRVGAELVLHRVAALLGVRREQLVDLAEDEAGLDGDRAAVALRMSRVYGLLWALGWWVGRRRGEQRDKGQAQRATLPQSNQKTVPQKQCEI